MTVDEKFLLAQVASGDDRAFQTLFNRYNSDHYDLGLRSWFGRINYNYDNKYLFEANIRRDGSSRFADGHKWGTFPSFSAGWVMTEEPFMKGTRRVLDMLKLRASWGKLGNQNINSYYMSDVLNTGYNYSFGGTLSSGVAVKTTVTQAFLMPNGSSRQRRRKHVSSMTPKDGFGPFP